MELSQKAEALGANGLLLVTPYYNKTSQRGLVASFNRIAGSVKIPCIVYNVPSRTGLNILPETYYELSKTQNIVATKEANHDISALIKTRELCGDDLTVYSGEDTQTLPIASLGGKGVISTFSNIMPKEMHELATASVAGDLKTAQALTFKYSRPHERTVHGRQPNPGKAGIEPDGLQLRPLPLAACRYVR